MDKNKIMSVDEACWKLLNMSYFQAVDRNQLNMV